MTILPNMYASAFIDALTAAPQASDEVVRRFVRLLDRHGVLASAERIVRAIEMELTKRAGGKWVEIEYARDIGAELRRTIHSTFAPHDHIEERMTPTLVGGVRITMDGAREIDQSLLGRLRQL